MFDILAAIIIGILAGMVTGIIPSLHVNSVGVVVFSFSSVLLGYVGVNFLATFFISIAITHAMFEFIPSLIIGVPCEDTVLSVQPAHRLLIDGRAGEAVRLFSFGGYFSVILLVLLMPLIFIVLPVLYGFFHDYTAYLLIGIMCVILCTVRGGLVRKGVVVLIFLISGVVGTVVLGSCFGGDLGLLCLLTGMFSVSNLLYNFNSGENIPSQRVINSVCVDGSFVRSVFAGSISGCILGLLPGLGPAQGTVIAQALTLNRDVGAEEFLITGSGINISDTLFSIIAIYLIGNPRSAISMYVNVLVEDMSFWYVVFFIFVSVTVVSVSCILAVKVGDFFVANAARFDYGRLNVFIVVSITLFVLLYCFFTGGCVWFCIIVYVTSIALGIVVNVLDLNKSVLMGVLIVPSVLTYLGLF